MFSDKFFNNIYELEEENRKKKGLKPEERSGSLAELALTLQAMQMKRLKDKENELRTR